MGGWIYHLGNLLRFELGMSLAIDQKRLSQLQVDHVWSGEEAAGYLSEKDTPDKIYYANYRRAAEIDH